MSRLTGDVDGIVSGEGSRGPPAIGDHADAVLAAVLEHPVEALQRTEDEEEFPRSHADQIGADGHAPVLPGQRCAGAGSDRLGADSVNAGRVVVQVDLLVYVS